MKILIASAFLLSQLTYAVSHDSLLNQAPRSCEETPLPIEKIDWPEDGIMRPPLKECDDIKEVSYSGFKIKGCYDSNRIMILLNGTSAPCAFYKDVQLEAARRGYLTICPEDGNVGSGREGVRAFEYLRGKGSKSETILVTGHSQGGHGAASTALRLQRKYPYLTVDILPVFPYFWNLYWPGSIQSFPEIKGRKLVLRGTKDTTSDMTIVARGYNQLSEPKKMIEVETSHLRFNPYWSDLLKNFD